MSDALRPPEDLTDLTALADWAQRIGEYFKGLNHQAGLESATSLARALVQDPPKPKRIEAAVKLASEQLVRAGLETSRDAYQRLLGPTETLHDSLPEGSEDRLKVEQSIATFRAVIELFEEALAGIDQGGAEGQARMERAVATAQKKIAAIPK